MTAVDALRRVARGTAWYVTSVMGDRAYADYVAHHRGVHPGEEPLSEREFWRDRHRRQERDPSGRCC